MRDARIEMRSARTDSLVLREKTTYNDESTFSLLNFVRDLIAQNQYVSEICRKLIISKTKTKD